jgi:hypothetical protein
MNELPDVAQAQDTGPARSSHAPRRFFLIFVILFFLGGLGILWATRASPASQCSGAGPCLFYFYADW